MRFLIFAIYWPRSQLTTNPPCSKHCPVLPADRLLGESYTCFHQVSDVENHTVEFSANVAIVQLQQSKSPIDD